MIVIYIQDYFFETTLGQNVIFLSDEDQKKITNDFVKSMPWHSFGRKNIGYLYAITNGAKVIWDFDDDNILKFWIKNASPDNALEIDQFIENIMGKILKFKVDFLKPVRNVANLVNF